MIKILFLLGALGVLAVPVFAAPQIQTGVKPHFPGVLYRPVIGVPRVQTVSSLQKIAAFAPGVLDYYMPAPVHLRAARGEWESFQIVIHAQGKTLREVGARATQLICDNGVLAPQNVEFYWENYVLVSHPSGNWASHDQEDKTMLWPDALIPTTLQPQKAIPSSTSEVLWCAVHVPQNAAPGEYSGVVNIYADGRATPVVYELTVENIELPAPTLRANVAVYYEILKDWYAKNLHQNLDENLKKKYYDFLLDYRINAYDLPVNWDSPEAAKYLRDPRVLGVRLPPLDDKKNFELALKVLRENHALSKAYYYRIDEPSPAEYSHVIETEKQLKAIDLKLKQCVTVHPNDSLENAVDIWCPNIGDVFGLGHLDELRLAEERLKGRETWWYTMVEPKNPYPTWLLDDDAKSVRVYGALMARYGITGFVYSMVHGWGPKPLENLESFAGTNGDGTLLYPSELVGGSGPMPSIRLMLLRDAIEDYELIHALPKARRWAWLQTLLPHPLPEVPRLKAFSNMTDALRSGADFTGKGDAHGDLLYGFQSPFVVYGVSVAPHIDGEFSDATWKQDIYHSLTFIRADWTSITDDTELWLTHDEKNLYAAFRAKTSTLDKDWCAVEVAPSDASIRFRFVVTPQGKGIVEKHTREGRFQLPDFDWKFAVTQKPGAYQVEMQIPLRVVDDAKSFRFNALRRIGGTSPPLIVRDSPDAGDVTLMPIAELD